MKALEKIDVSLDTIRKRTLFLSTLDEDEILGEISRLDSAINNIIAHVGGYMESAHNEKFGERFINKLIDIKNEKEY